MTALGTPLTASASTGKKFLETLGISTAVGAVLGASTLPFYEHPLDHKRNIAIGAAAGAVIGLGIIGYGAISGSSGSPNSGGWAYEKDQTDRMDDGVAQSGARVVATALAGAAVQSLSSSQTARSVWMPLVSVTW